MNGLMFQKRPRKSGKRTHAKSSILQRDIDRNRCWLCMQLRHDYSEHTPGALHKHHVYMGPLRSVSEAQGFYVYLCPKHHTQGPEAVHRNAGTCHTLQAQMQKAYEKNHTREEFLQLIGRSYVE